MANVTILGLGAMGSRIAFNLLRSGHQVTVWNRNADRVAPLVEEGALHASTPVNAVAESDFVISMVRDDDASRQVWLDESTGALAGMPKESVAIESSTLTVMWIKELAEKMSEAGRMFLDAPVAGSRPQAEAAQLIYFVGGEPAHFAAASPLLETLGSAVHHAGPTGSGAAIKLMVNALFGAQVAIVSELLGLMKGLGTAPATAAEIVMAGPIASPASKAATEAILAGKFAPMFPIELVEKDFSYVVKTAEENGATVPISAATQAVFRKAIAEGFGEDNITGVAQLYL